MVWKEEQIMDTWVCERCGGIFPAVKGLSPDLQKMFDEVTICSDCLRADIANLAARFEQNDDL